MIALPMKTIFPRERGPPAKGGARQEIIFRNGGRFLWNILSLRDSTPLAL